MNTNRLRLPHLPAFPIPLDEKPVFRAPSTAPPALLLEAAKNDDGRLAPVTEVSLSPSPVTVGRHASKRSDVKRDVLISNLPTETFKGRFLKFLTGDGLGLVTSSIAVGVAKAFFTSSNVILAGVEEVMDLSGFFLLGARDELRDPKHPETAWSELARGFGEKTRGLYSHWKQDLSHAKNWEDAYRSTQTAVVAFQKQSEDWLVFPRDVWTRTKPLLLTCLVFDDLPCVSLCYWGLQNYSHVYPAWAIAGAAFVAAGLFAVPAETLAEISAHRLMMAFMTSKGARYSDYVESRFYFERNEKQAGKVFADLAERFSLKMEGETETYRDVFYTEKPRAFSDKEVTYRQHSLVTHGVDVVTANSPAEVIFSEPVERRDKNGNLYYEIKKEKLMWLDGRNKSLSRMVKWLFRYAEKISPKELVYSRTKASKPDGVRIVLDAIKDHKGTRYVLIVKAERGHEKEFREALEYLQQNYSLRATTMLTNDMMEKLNES